MSYKILAVIPCLNEEATIEAVIRNLQDIAPKVSICVVDDGSIDKTSEIARNTLRKTDFLLSFPKNRGIAIAVKTAAILGLAHDFEALMQVDGDGQHPSAAITGMLSEAKKRRESSATAFTLIGSRYLEEGRLNGTTFIRKMGNRFLALTIKSLYRGVEISDPTSGLRIYSGDALRIVAKYYPVKWPEPIFISILAKMRSPIFEIGVDMHPRYFGKSSLTGIKSLKFMFYTVSKIVQTKWR
jgi:hypothetical protein